MELEKFKRYFNQKNIKNFIISILLIGTTLTFITAQLTTIRMANKASNERDILRTENIELKTQVQDFSEMAACRAMIQANYQVEFAKGFVLMSEGFTLIEEGLLTVVTNDKKLFEKEAEELKKNSTDLKKQNAIIKISADQYARVNEVCISQLEN